MGCRGGIFNSFKFEQGRLGPEPIRVREGDQNGDFGWILLRRDEGRGDSSIFPHVSSF